MAQQTAAKKAAGSDKKKMGLPPGTMTDEHKAALARGRQESRAIRNYLGLLAEQQMRRPREKRGRKPTSAEELRKRLAECDNALDRVHLRAAVRDAEDREAAWTPSPATEAIEAQFVQFVRPYSERYGLTARDWREEGVPAHLLRQAGFENHR